MTNPLPFRSAFIFGAEQLLMSLPVTPWAPSNAVVGGDIDADSGVRATFTVRRDELLTFSLRFYESEWPAVQHFIDTAMIGIQITWLPDQDDTDESFDCFLLHPAVGENFQVTPDGNYPKVFHLQIVLVQPDGSPWAIRAFTRHPEAPPPPIVVPPAPDESYIIHTFTINDTFIIASGSGEVQYLLVAGGGGGGACTGTGVGCGGGGGGGVLESAAVLGPGAYPVTVGSGGLGGRPGTWPVPTIATGGDGSDSVFNGETAHGGGGGSAVTAGRDGGSGGAGRASRGDIGLHASTTDYQGFATPPGQGHDSGHFVYDHDTDNGGFVWGAGGGGAGDAGENGGQLGQTVSGIAAGSGSGGPGRLSMIPHVPTYFGGGGGGSQESQPGAVSAGGTGGGGHGGIPGYVIGASGFAGSGTDGLGGGGGGGGGDSSGFAGTPIGGGDGGKGVVVIRYLKSTGIVATGGDRQEYDV